MEVDVKKVMEHLNEIYQCGAKPDGTFTRMAYSREMIKREEKSSAAILKSWVFRHGSIRQGI
ncbi:MAG: hypothetical protein ACLUUO_11975 [Sellimonas intestinalis]